MCVINTHVSTCLCSTPAPQYSSAMTKKRTAYRLPRGSAAAWHGIPWPCSAQITEDGFVKGPGPEGGFSGRRIMLQMACTASRRCWGQSGLTALPAPFCGSAHQQHVSTSAIVVVGRSPCMYLPSCGQQALLAMVCAMLLAIGRVAAKTHATHRGVNDPQRGLDLLQQHLHEIPSACRIADLRKPCHSS